MPFDVAPQEKPQAPDWLDNPVRAAPISEKEALLLMADIFERFPQRHATCALRKCVDGHASYCALGLAIRMEDAGLIPTYLDITQPLLRALGTSVAAVNNGPSGRERIIEGCRHAAASLTV